MDARSRQTDTEGGPGETRARRPEQHRHGATFGIERMNAVSDGVFAIILTLLVLDLKLPDSAEDQAVIDALASNWHVFVAWLISFVAIARFWVVHHAVTSGLRRCHTGTITLNFAVLGVASLVPFSADLIGNDRVVEPWSTAVFAANFALLSVTLGLLTHHVASEPDLLDPARPAVALTRYRRHHLVVAPLVFLAAATLAFTHPYVSIALLVAEFAAAAWWSLRAGRRTEAGGAVGVWPTAERDVVAGPDGDGTVGDGTVGDGAAADGAAAAAIGTAADAIGTPSRPTATPRTARPGARESSGGLSLGAEIA